MVISPAKKLDFDTPCKDLKATDNQFLEEAQLLIKHAKALSKSEIAKLMKLSDSLAQLNVDRYNSWSLPFDTSNAKHAIFAFRGDVYQGLDADSLTKTQLSFAQKHLMILSGLYGLLRPFDLIQPYRLEMGTKLQNPLGKDLYAFWNHKLTDHLNQVLKKKKAPLVNLASSEYFKAIQPSNLDYPVIHPVFKEKKDGVYKTIGIHAKKARGKMVRFALDEKISEAEQLREFAIDGYRFSKKLSDEAQWVFTR